MNRHLVGVLLVVTLVPSIGQTEKAPKLPEKLYADFKGPWRPTDDRFRSKNLKILTTDGIVSFVRNDGRPNGDIYSDHLPIWFKLDLRRRTRHASDRPLA